MKKWLLGSALLIGASALCGGAQASVTFNTFVSGVSINAAVGQNNTIAFNYAGSFFVGSVYTGPNNNQLYATDLNGANVQKFGNPIPGFSGEVVVAAGLGQGGFAKGAIYAGNGAGNQIYLVPPVGAPVLFGTTGNNEVIRQILLDPGGSFGGAMIVTTNSGRIYTFNAAGTPTLLANVGADTEGMDIATSAWGKYAGNLIVASEGSGQVLAISPGGSVSVLKDSVGSNIYIALAETVSAVPLNLGSSGNPLEGFYVANYPSDIQFADASQFAGLQGDIIVTSEFSSSSPLWALHYLGDTLDAFTMTLVGNLPLQSEDGIFVTAERIREVGTPGGVPEPATLALVGAGFAGLGALRRVRRRKA